MCSRIKRWFIFIIASSPFNLILFLSALWAVKADNISFSAFAPLHCAKASPYTQPNKWFCNSVGGKKTSQWSVSTAPIWQLCSRSLLSIKLWNILKPVAGSYSNILMIFMHAFLCLLETDVRISQQPVLFSKLSLKLHCYLLMWWQCLSDFQFQKAILTVNTECCNKASKLFSREFKWFVHLVIVIIS